jgi:S-adenosylmethionine synthetase
MMASAETPRAKVTSAAVVSLPRSPLEEAVYRVERHLTSHVFRQAVPLGPDVKVMGVRAGAEVRLTVAAAVLSGDVADVEAYEAVVGTAAWEAASVAEPIVDAPVAISVNADGEHP